MQPVLRGKRQGFLSDSPVTIRLDRWLWSARFYKTRQLATDAIKGGHVEVNGTRAKPARAVKIGDRICVRKAPFDFVIVVLGLRQRRVSARDAQGLYEESAESVAERETLKMTLRSQAQQVLFDEKRPSKRDRRDARDRKRGG